MLQNDFFGLVLPAADERESWISRRDGEFRLGQETLFRSAGSDAWKQRRYHVLGIAEDVGPRANGGNGGADKAFGAFIGRFLAIQSNRFLSGSQLAVHGVIAGKKHRSDPDLRTLVTKLDEIVSAWAEEVAASGGIPVVIGGGHNNAYGLIKGVAAGTGRQLAVVNLDPHADTRELEGRHSGNPFSYAWGEGLLTSYTVLGLHQSYNNESILKRLELMKSRVSFFEDWVDDPRRFYEDVGEAAEEQRSQLTGIELDMDSIANMPSSAFTPSGVTVEQARHYVRMLARTGEVGYVHFPEAAPADAREQVVVGKTLAYLAADFIKCHKKD